MRRVEIPVYIQNLSDLMVFVIRQLQASGNERPSASQIIEYLKVQCQVPEPLLPPYSKIADRLDGCD